MDSLSNLIINQKNCFAQKDGFEMECAAKALEKYVRDNPSMENFIYPWRNFDWSYEDYVKNNYDPIKLGASSKGTTKDLIKDIDVMIKIIRGFISDPNPAPNSKAKDPNSKGNDLVTCQVNKNVVMQISNVQQQIKEIKKMIDENQSPQNDKLFQERLANLVRNSQVVVASCGVLNGLSASFLNQKKPYNDPFFDRDINGEASSSYFAKVGSCPTSIKNQNECLKKGYNWIPNPLFYKPGDQKGVNTTAGSCFKDRYIYINNKPGLSIGQVRSFKGLIPSLIKNISDIAPDKLMFAAAGFGVPGLDIQQCEEGEGKIDHQTVSKNDNNSKDKSKKSIFGRMFKTCKIEHFNDYSAQSHREIILDIIVILIVVFFLILIN